MTLLQSGITKSLAVSYDIDNSLRLDGWPGTTAQYLTRSPSSSSNRRTFTISLWWKLALDKAEDDYIIKVKPNVDNQFMFHKIANNVTGSENKIAIVTEVSTSVKTLETSRVFRDPSAWYHFVIAVDTTQSTASDRLKLYVNGVQETDFSTEEYPDQDWELPYNESGVNQDLLYSREDSGRSPSGYFAEWYSIDGTALTASDFGETNSTTNQWIPLDSDDVKDAVTFGANGFYLKFGSTELDNSFDDSSSGDHTITANGNTYNQRPQYHTVTANGGAHLIGPKQGTSIITFDGTGDYLTAPDSADWNFGTDNFTIEAWANPDDSNYGYFYSQGAGAATTIQWANFESGGSDGWWVKVEGTILASFVGDPLPANTWSHCALVRYGDEWDIYVDGVSVWNTTNSITVPDYSSVVYLGTYINSSDYVDGYMDAIRISDSARYTATFTPPTSAFDNDSNTKLLIQSGTDGSQTFDDLSTPDHTITANGDVRWFAPKVGAGALAFGPSKYFEIPDSVAWTLTQNFTIECYMKLSGGVQIMFDHYLGAGAQRSWQLETGFTFTLSPDGGSGSNETATFTSSLTADTWYHIALCRSGDNLRLFLDGTQVGSTATNVTSLPYESTATLQFPSADGGADAAAYYDGVRISKSARYTSDFIAPTTAFTDDVNTVLLLNGDVNQGTWVQDQSTGLAISTDSRIKFDGTGDYLSVADGSDFVFGTGNFTLEAWINFSTVQNQGIMLLTDAATSDTPYFDYYGGALRFGVYGIALINTYTWTPVAGTWYHVAAARSGSTCKLFIDGAEVDSDSNSTDFTSDGLLIGAWSSRDWDGYMDEIRISDSARYTGAFTPQTTAFISDSNTMLLIHSDYTGGLGADSSGNYNNFTATNLDANDQMIDTPTNNFATLNPISPRNNGTTWVGAWAEGNLDYLNSSGALSGVSTSTMATDSTNKFYYEFYVKVSTSGDCGIGQCGADVDSRLLGGPGGSEGSPFYTWATQAGNYFVSGVSTSAGVTAATDDIVQIAYDASSGKIWYGKNNTWNGSGDPANGTNAAQTLSGGGSMVPLVSGYNGDRFVVNFGQDSSFAGNKTSGSAAAQDANEVGDFYYAPPTDFLALCADNISAPEIALPGKNFNTVLYTGNGSDATAITGAGFEPGMVWIKNRSGSPDTPDALADQVRGADNILQPPSTELQFNDATHIQAFDSDGFTIGTNSSVNTSSKNYASWNWKAGGAPTADNDNTSGAMDANSVSLDGSLQAAYTPSGSPSIYPIRMSINTTAGFSIVQYDGNATSGATVPHGLSEAPTFVCNKVYESGAVARWFVQQLGDGDVSLALDNTDRVDANIVYWNDTPAGSSVVTLGSWSELNRNAVSAILYSFHSVEGYSKVGSYEGNGNADGPFIYTGFRPAFIMTKSIDDAGPGIGVSDWQMFDDKRIGYNVDNNAFSANLDSAEVTTDYIDILSNGFKNRIATDPNVAETYLYLAFASSPFKTSNAR